MPSLQEIKDGKKDVIISVVVISLIIFVFLWRFVFSDLEYEYVPEPILKTAPEIDFGYLEGPEFDYFHEYQQIKPLGEEFMGRENPFLPHSGRIIQRRQTEEQEEPEEEGLEETEEPEESQS